MISRRGFLVRGAASVAGVGLLYGSAACRAAPTRQSVLHALVLEQVVPAVRALPPASKELELSLHKLGRAALPLTEVRTSFRKALLAWQRAQTFRSGPLVDSNAFLRAAFWPVRMANVTQVIEGSAPIDAALVNELGVDAKGLFALERLLWERDPAGADWLKGAHAARACALASALASDVRVRADAGLSALGDGSAFAQTFSADGQASLALLLTQHVEMIESIAVDRLQRALALHEQGRLRSGDLPADFCGLSAQIPLNALSALRDQYAPGKDTGLSVLVRKAAPAIDSSVGKALDEAVAALRALGKPIEQAVVSDASLVSYAFARVKALEVTYKTELASALAVTLSIAAGDGD